MISHVMYICFMALHSLWCEFGWFNPALSIVIAKFAFVSHDGAKWQQNLEKRDAFFCLGGGGGVMNLHLLLRTARNDLVCYFLCEKVQYRQHNRSE